MCMFGRKKAQGQPMQPYQAKGHQQLLDIPTYANNYMCAVPFFYSKKHHRDDPTSLSEGIQNALETIQRTAFVKELERIKANTTRYQDHLLERLLLSAENLAYILRSYRVVGDMEQVFHEIQTKHEFYDFLAVWSINDAGISLYDVLYFSCQNILTRLAPTANLYSFERYMDLPVWTLNHPSVLLAVPEVFEDLPWFRAEIAPVLTIENHGLHIINNNV